MPRLPPSGWTAPGMSPKGSMADPDCTVLAAETEEDAIPARLINGCPAAAGVRAGSW